MLFIRVQRSIFISFVWAYGESYQGLFNGDAGMHKYYDDDSDFCSTFLECWMKLVGQRDLWKMKIFIFHCVMVTRFILSGVGSWLGAELSMLMMVSLIPLGDWCTTVIVYWIAILTETAVMLIQTLMDIYSCNRCRVLHGNKIL